MVCKICCRWFPHLQMVTHPSTNSAWRRVTILIDTDTLPLSHATTIISISLVTYSLVWQLWMLCAAGGRTEPRARRTEKFQGGIHGQIQTRSSCRHSAETIQTVGGRRDTPEAGDIDVHCSSVLIHTRYIWLMRHYGVIDSIESAAGSWLIASNSHHSLWLRCK